MNSILLSLALLMGFAPAEHAPRSTVATQLPQHVLVLMNSGRCSGSVIKKDIVLTAAHCVDDLPKGATVKVVFTGRGDEQKAFMPVYVGKRLTGTDIALLQGDTGDIVPLPVAIAPPASLPGITFYVSNRDRQEAIPAVVVKPKFEPEGVVLSLFADTWPGDSGSALLNSKGEVIGVVFAYFREVPHSGFATSFEPILKALRSLK